MLCEYFVSMWRRYTDDFHAGQGFDSAINLIYHRRADTVDAMDSLALHYHCTGIIISIELVNAMFFPYLTTKSYVRSTTQKNMLFNSTKKNFGIVKIK